MSFASSLAWRLFFWSCLGLLITSEMVNHAKPELNTIERTVPIVNSHAEFVDITNNPMHVAEDLIERATVLVGAVTESSGAQTFGTGFIIEHRGRVYVATCKHVIDEASSPNLFAIPRPQKTMSPPGGYSVLSLSKPIHHPKDGTRGTYDIALLKIINVNTRQLRARGAAPIRLTLVGEAEPTEGLVLVATGYPVDYAVRELALGKPDRLRPLRVSGRVMHIRLDALTSQGFGGTLLEGHFAETIERPLGKGASGGAVYVSDGGQIRVVGMVLGSAALRMSANGRTVDLNGFIFANSLRIIEALP